MNGKRAKRIRAIIEVLYHNLTPEEKRKVYRAKKRKRTRDKAMYKRLSRSAYARICSRGRRNEV